MIALWLALLFVWFAIVFWLFLCNVGGTEFEIYPGYQRRRKARRRAEQAKQETRPNEPVTQCGCNDCLPGSSPR